MESRSEFKVILKLIVWQLWTLELALKPKGPQEIKSKVLARKFVKQRKGKAGNFRKATMSSWD